MSEVLNKCVTLLNLLKPKDGCNEWGASELARLAGYNDATTHRILQDMLKYGLVGQNKSTKKFHLGYSLFELGYMARSLFSINEYARPHMEELANITGESIYLNILIDDNEALLIDSIDSSHHLRIVEPLGLRLPLHIGATRKIILAYLNKEKQDEYIKNCVLKSRTEKTIINETDLKEELIKIKKKGFAVSYGETTKGTAGVAVPIFGINKVEGSLGIATPDIRLNEENIAEYVELLLAKSKRISETLGGGFFQT